MKLGKKPAAPRPTDFKLTRYAVTLPTPPHRFGYGTIYNPTGGGWHMFANDRLGDCVSAEAAHGTLLFNHIARHPVEFTDNDVIRFYSETSGYDPSDPSTDQGTDMHTAMGFRRSTGIQDALGKRHKIDSYVSVDPHNFDLLLQAVYVFGVAALGFEFPASAMDQFNNGKPWNLDPSADNQIESGHDVLAVGSLDSTNEVSVITWGQRQRMTRSFYEAYNDETWVPLSLELLRGGLGLHHLDVAALKTDLAAL